TRRADHRLPAAGQRRRSGLRQGPGAGVLRIRDRVRRGGRATRPSAAWRLRCGADRGGARGADTGYRAGDGRRRAPAAERVQGDDGEKRGRSGPASGGRCVVTATRSADPGPQSRTRVEAPLKLTGAARYAADHHPDGILHAVLVGAPVAAGRLRGVDTAAALVLPGVTAVLTAADLPRFPELPPPSAVRVMPFSDDRIWYEGQPVAIVLADSVEAAEAGRAAVAVDCERETPVLIGYGRREPVMAEERGDVDAALAASPIQIEQTYLQAPRHHHTMETSGTVARWDGGRLTLWDSVQASSTVIAVVSAALGLDPADVRVVARHTGGGFGAKGYIWPHEILAAAAARVAGRPVKLHLRRSDQ